MTLSQQETYSIIYQTAMIVLIFHMFMFMWAACFARLGKKFEDQNIDSYDTDDSEYISDIPHYDSDSD